MAVGDGSRWERCGKRDELGFDRSNGYNYWHESQTSEGGKRFHLPEDGYDLRFEKATG